MALIKADLGNFHVALNVDVIDTLYWLDAMSKGRVVLLVHVDLWKVIRTDKNNDLLIVCQAPRPNFFYLATAILVFYIHRPPSSDLSIQWFFVDLSLALVTDMNIQ